MLKTIIFRGLVLFLLALFASCSEPISKEQIIQNYYEAIGGYEELKSIKSIHSKISHREHGLDFMIMLEIYGRRQDMRRVNWSVEKYNMRGAEGYTGTTPWEVNQETGMAEVLTGAKGDAARRGAEFDESFVDAEQKAHSVEYVGTEEVFGKETHHLRVTLNDGWVKDYYFDKESDLILGLQKTMPIHGEGEPIGSITQYADYRESQGVLFPHKFEEYNTKTDEWMSTNEIILHELNVDFADSLISPPNELKD